MPWQNNNMGVVPLKKEVLYTFSRIEGYETELGIIPTTVPQMAMAAMAENARVSRGQIWDMG
jgi:hypothetical protein